MFLLVSFYGPKFYTIIFSTLQKKAIMDDDGDATIQTQKLTLFDQKNTKIPSQTSNQQSNTSEFKRLVSNTVR
jgi:hypothetical protein